MESCKTLALALITLAICGCMLADPASQFASGDLPVASALRQSVVSGKLPQLGHPDLQDIQSSLSAVYDANHFEPLWFSAGQLTPKGLAILNALRISWAKGLNPEQYDVRLLEQWAQQLQTSRSLDTRQAALLDLALTVELMRYAGALHQGRVDPGQVHFAIRPKGHLDPAKFVLEFLSATTSLPDLLAQVEPPFRGYRNTLAALAHYQQLAAQEPAKMPSRPRLPLRPGQQYDDLPALAARLQLLGDLAAPAPLVAGHVTYTGDIVEAMKRFQVRHGLISDGIIDLRTWNAFTVPLSQRVEQLALTLERWRWMPGSITPTIVVNIPEFELRAFDENEQMALRMHVIVGKAYHRKTPIFEDRLESIIVRPWWNVPLSIQCHEMVPQIRRNPEYLRKNNLQIVDRARKPVSWDPQQPPIDRIASGELRLRQEPGPENSLGLLKFDFPNDYSVYMHGTPANQLFARARRDFSHGCIRLQDPDSLAVWLLRDMPEWNRTTIAEACQGDQTLRIRLRRPVAVLVLYATAVVEENGEVRFFEDIYGYDSELRKALSACNLPDTSQTAGDFNSQQLPN